jgi:tripeptidyl-peptidase-1
VFAPSDESVQAVLDWLAEHGITGNRVKQSQSLNWIHANVSAAEAEKLLNTAYFEYVHGTTGQPHIACEAYSLPEYIQEHVDFVTPTVHFDAKVKNPKKRRMLNENEINIAKRQTTTVAGHDVQPGTGISIGSPGDGSLPKSGGEVPFGTILNQLENCDISIVPNCLRVLYEFPPYLISNPQSRLYATVFEFLLTNDTRFLRYC